MQLISLSWQPHRPCLVLKWPSASILLDCAVDMTPLSSFLPATISMSPRLSALPSFRSSMQYLKRCSDKVFVDAPFEVHCVPLHSVPLDTVDVILVSNWMSLLALPFFTEHSNFRGAVYATEPTLQLGRLVMEEILEFIGRVDRDAVDSKWRQPEIISMFPNSPSSDPREWVQFYTREQMQSSLAKVQLISFREAVEIYGGVTVAAYSSGYSIGSCNWVVRTEHEKIGYLSATSSRTSHTKAVHWDQLRGSDALILTSVCRFPEHNPETSVFQMFATVAETLKKNGSVLLPVCPTGVLYDLLEVTAMHMDQHNISLDVPIYFISPVAESVLAYSNIYAEWLSEKKQNMAYIPDEPFTHGHMIKGGRLMVFDSIHGQFCQQMRTPCVLFTGHPSLRFGDATHFLEMWGNDARNALILTDPDYPIDEVYGPYQSLSIRAYFFPIETRLDFSQLNPSIMPDLSPKLLVMPDAYSTPPAIARQRVDFVVSYPGHQLLTFRYGDTVTVPSMTKRKRIRLHPDLQRNIDIRAKRDHCDFGMCEVKAYLSAYNNALELNPDSAAVKSGQNSSRPIRPVFTGNISAESLLRHLNKKDMKATMETSDGQKIIKIPSLRAEVRFEGDGLKTRIVCPTGDGRRRIAEVIASCLKSL